MPSTRYGWPLGVGGPYRCTTRHLKTPIIVFVLLFVWLQLMMIGVRQSPSSVGPTDSVGVTLSKDRSQFTYSEFLHNVRSSNGSHSTNSTIRESLNITDIRWQINRANGEQQIWNLERFGPVTPDTVVFVVQVHTRLQYLATLIDSFRNTRGIEGALLIFSHDFVDPEINLTVQSIDFARVLQIFYPFSTQIHANSFPGQDPNDCPWDIKKEEASRKRCNNADHPDLYGHYREAKYTQIKHHWWWKINRVFEGLHALKNHTGLVVFLEEDHFVVPDILHVLGLLEVERTKQCPQCNVLSLGTYQKTVNFAGDSGKAEIWPWIASKHNMGMVLNRNTWQEIRRCAEKFCSFDDYNWDWSLQHVSATCLSHRLTVAMVKAPRVFHIGECGVHHKDKNCSANLMLAKVVKVLTSAKDYLFPNKLSMVRTSRRVGKVQKGNGGWGDIRDHWLCLHLLNASFT